MELQDLNTQVPPTVTAERQSPVGQNATRLLIVNGGREQHEITRKRVIGELRVVLRATCSCGRFSADADRIKTASRRKLDRQIAEHLASVQP